MMSLADFGFSQESHYLTWAITGLSILLVAFKFLLVPSYSISKVVAKSTSANQNVVSFNYTTYPRAGEQNFGYGDVRVVKLLVHPIKSCRGTSVQSAKYTPQGLENDRKWCIVDAETHEVITAREVAKMVLVTPAINIESGTLDISFPSDSGCESFSVPLHLTPDLMTSWKSFSDVKLWAHNDLDGYVCESTTSTRTPSEIMSQYMDRPVHLLIKGPKIRPCGTTTAFPDLNASAVYQDGYPLLVVSQENMGEIEKEMRDHLGKQGIEEDLWRDGKVVVERFRPNIVFEGAGAFAEDLWQKIGIGEGGFLVVSKCQRCLLPNVSPETGVRDKAVPYKVLMKFRTGVDPSNKWKPCIGCNAVPLTDGVVKVGDRVTVKKVVG